LSIGLSAAVNLYQAYEDIMDRDTDWVDLCALEVSALMKKQPGGTDEETAANITGNLIQLSGRSARTLSWNTCMFIPLIRKSPPDTIT